MTIGLLLVATVWWAGVLASEPPSGGDWISYLLNGGPFAIVVLLLITDKLTTPGERDRLRAENEQLRTEVKTLNENLRNEIVPPLTEMNRLNTQVIEILSDEDRFPRKRTR